MNESTEFARKTNRVPRDDEILDWTEIDSPLNLGNSILPVSVSPKIETLVCQ